MPSEFRDEAKRIAPSGSSGRSGDGPYWNGTTPQFPGRNDESCPRWRAFRRAYDEAELEIREELLALGMAWPQLPPTIRAAILTLAAASDSRGAQ